MRTRIHRMPRAGRRHRMAALVTATTAAVTLTSPAAFAAPGLSPAGTLVSAPPSAPKSTTLVPQSVTLNNHAEIAAVSSKMLADPRGWELATARRIFGTDHGKASPGNVSVEWYDFDWLLKKNPYGPWFRAGKFYYNMLRALKITNDKFANIPGDYQIVSRAIRNIKKNRKLFKALQANPAHRLLQSATSSAFHSTHSEMAPRERLISAATETIKEWNPQLSHDEARNMAMEIVDASSVGMASELSSCPACAPHMKAFNSQLNLAEYGTTATQHQQAVGSARDVMSVATATVGQENAEAEKQEQLKNLNLPAGCSTTQTASGPGERGGGRVAAMVAMPMAEPCPKAPAGGLAAARKAKNLGGVDFSTLEMRYLSDDPGGDGVQYAFSGRAASQGSLQDFGSGFDAATNSTADLRTWLVLDPKKFWVNLNPDEPDRIIDPQLGKTNAGRALLEADWEMKRTSGKLVDPDTEFGRRYWNSLAGNCYTSRMWIIPGDVVVREDGDSLYVLKAKLDVKAQATHISNTGKNACNPDPQTIAKNQRMEQKMLVPKVVKAVNTAPEYAPLRRAFLARVIAQWIRKRHRDGHRTSFDDLIDSGDLGPAVLDGGWRPKQVYDAYVHSIQNGEFTYTQTTREGGTKYRHTMVYGGVDFSKLHTSPLSAEQMKQQHPKLPETAKASLKHPSSTPDGMIWLGETAPSPKAGLWTRTTDTLRSFVTGRTGLLILVVGALGVVAFGMRGGTRHRRRAS